MSYLKKNVVIFGEAGSGKSSLVNLLLGQNKADVSDQAIGCTFKFRKFETPNFNLYDTVGLSEGECGTVKQDLAVMQLMTLLKSLKDGISMLIFVIEKGRIKKSLNENYKLFVDVICMNMVPVLLVITHCEMETVPGTWWNQNKEHFANYGMKFESVVSGCALQPSSVPEMIQHIIKEKNVQTAEQILQSIRDISLSIPWQVEGGWSNWLILIIKGVVNIFTSFFAATIQQASITERLTSYFSSEGYDEKKTKGTVARIVDEIESRQ